MEFPSFFYLSAPTSPFGYSTPGSTADKTNPDNEYKLPARVNSFSTIAFSDELFSSGKLLPLKLPPGLQTSVPTSPTRSLGSRVRNPFAQRCTWNDSFDPFVIALEKVSEETEGRMSVHRRSHSYSPSISCTIDWDHDQEKEPMITEMMDRKGSMYSKLVRSQAMEKSSTPRTTMKRLWLGRRVRDAEPASCKESKMKKVKSVLLRYASLKKETGESKQTREITRVSKVSYFMQLSLSFKTNLGKKESVDAKRALVKHEMKLPSCLGYASESPKWM